MAVPHLPLSFPLPPQTLLGVVWLVVGCWLCQCDWQEGHPEPAHPPDDTEDEDEFHSDTLLSTNTYSRSLSTADNPPLPKQDDKCPNFQREVQQKRSEISCESELFPGIFLQETSFPYATRHSPETEQQELCSLGFSSQLEKLTPSRIFPGQAWRQKKSCGEQVATFSSPTFLPSSVDNSSDDEDDTRSSSSTASSSSQTRQERQTLLTQLEQNNNSGECKSVQPGFSGKRFPECGAGGLSKTRTTFKLITDKVTRIFF